MEYPNEKSANQTTPSHETPDKTAFHISTMPYAAIFTNTAEIINDLNAGWAFTGSWERIKWLNTPGPFYGADTDNCGTGPLEAPNNVSGDAYGYEFVYRQPINFYETRQVITAATCDCMGGYGCDGNSHWTYETVKAWWSRHRELETEINRIHNHQLGLGVAKDYYFFSSICRWKSYFHNELPVYLRVYAFFLLEGRFPQESDPLPLI